MGKLGDFFNNSFFQKKEGQNISKILKEHKISFDSLYNILINQNIKINTNIYASINDDVYNKINSILNKKKPLFVNKNQDINKLLNVSDRKKIIKLFDENPFIALSEYSKIIIKLSEKKISNHEIQEGFERVVLD